VADRSADWIAQADRDLDAARAQVSAGYYEWACFISQQAAEKALKAVLQSWGAEAWGHSVRNLLAAVEERAGTDARRSEAALTLDKFYIPARYPNGYAEGKPGDYITAKDAEDAVGSAEEIIRFGHGLLA
jgi:HEPN domain-containing protein